MATTKKVHYEYIGWLVGVDGGVEDLELHYTERDAQNQSHMYIRVEVDPVKSSPGKCVGTIPHVSK